MKPEDRHNPTGASPRHDRHYKTDPNGRFCIMQVSWYEGKRYRTVLPAPRFASLREADRYCRDWNVFGGAITFVVCEAG